MENMPTPNPQPPRPVVSYTDADGLLVETLYDPSDARTHLAVHRQGEPLALVDQLDLPNGERLTPYSASNNLLTSGCVLLPSEVGIYEDKASLLAEVRAFIERYVDLSPAFLDIAAHYVFLTWVHDAFGELGYLRFRGDYGTGKTRALLTIGSLCYKPFFASGASTVSPIFHVLDAFGGTLILDEADFRFSDATAELSKILNNGTVAGLPVLRTMSNRHRELNPQAFRVFGPKLVGMRESYQDAALESRFLTEETGRRPLSPHIPIHVPAAMRTEALALRNKLLAWRFDTRFSVAPDPSRLVDGVSPRLNQTALALLSIVDDDLVRATIRAELVSEEARVLHERASTPETTMLGVVLEAFAETSAPYVAVGDVAERFARIASDRFYQRPTNKWVGQVLRDRLRLQTTKSRGVYVIPQSERPKLERLAERMGLVLKTEQKAA